MKAKLIPNPSVVMVSVIQFSEGLHDLLIVTEI